jgi:AbiV family abortive infection protein
MEKPDGRPDPEKITATLEACVANGVRLLEDADWVLHLKPPATAMVLAVIAQEEFAKAFFLSLVRSNIIPWSPLLLRAMNDHACKHLVGLIIEYADPEWTELAELQKMYREESEMGDRMPNRVGSALEILRYEKIERWASKSWSWADDPNYDRDVLHIAEGSKDRAKQDALYVRIGRDGSLVTTPQSVKVEDVEREV